MPLPPSEPRPRERIVHDDLVVGGFGSRWVSRRQPLNTGVDEWHTPHPPSQVRAAARMLLEIIGHPLAVAEYHAEGGLSAITGAGALRLSPVLVTVWPRAAADGGTDVRVLGEAREGWIKQRGGEQIAREVGVALRELLGEPAAVAR